MKQNNCRFITHAALTSGENFYLPRHTERLVGLLYVRTGSVLFSSITGVETPLFGKSALLYPAWQQQKIAVQEDAAFLLAAFQQEEPEEVLEHWGKKFGPVCDCGQLPEAQRLLSQLEALTLGPSQFPYVQPVSQLLSLLLGQSALETANIPSYIQKVRTLIDTQYAQELSLDALAVQTGRSKFHLSRKFRDCYQVTPGEYLISVRLAHAAELLVKTTLPVREIAQRVGIANSAYFTATFKRHYGSSPREYRIRWRDKGEN